MKLVALLTVFLITRTKRSYVQSFQVAADLLDGLEHQHGEHDQHHGEHHAEHGGEHSHREHDGEQAHVQDPVNQDPFTSGLNSDLGENFLNIPGAATDPAPVFDPVPAFDPAPVSDLAPASDPVPVSDLVPAAADNTIQYSQDYDYDVSTQSAPSEAAAFASSGEAKQLGTLQQDSGLGSPGGYPEYAAVPQTSFTCDSQQYGGYFADPEAQCQVFHICLNGRKMGSFLCPNRTLFHQEYFVCDWWYNVDCNAATQSYALNANIGVVPEKRK